MKQFYELYKDDEFVTTLLTQINWSNHLLIMSGAKSAEERHFYMQACIKEMYSYRELERQMDSALYQRYMLSSKKGLPKSVPAAARENIFDSYVLEFLDLPEQYSENNLKKAIIGNLKKFILEFGKDLLLSEKNIAFRSADKIFISTCCSIIALFPVLYR